MKVVTILLFIACSAASMALYAQSNIQQATSINQNGVAPDPSAMLDVQASNKGMLVPRMTTAQRTAISFPATGLLVFDTTTGGFWFYNGAAWTSLSGGGGGTPSAISDADGNTKVQTEESPNENVIRFDLDGTENMVLRKNAGGSPRLELLNALNNTFVGQNAGNDNTTGASNTAIGNNALRLNTTISDLVAVGDSALYNNGVGANQSFHSKFNTAVGKKALFANTIGDHNTAIGNKALLSNTSGVGNTATGSEAMADNTAGYHNTGMGHQALADNTSGYRNTAIGFASMLKNTSGYHNTATGYQTLINNTTGFYNTATGFQALALNTTGFGNTATGYEAMFYNTTGSFNTANGYYALLNNTTGYSNVAIGKDALYRNTFGFHNVAIGDSALYNNGLGAVFGNGQALWNTAVGTFALLDNTTGSMNTASGYASLFNNTTGIRNTVMGSSALLENTTGSRNTAVGDIAGDQGSNNNNCTAIGQLSDVGTSSNSYTNAIAIGYDANTTSNNYARIGNTSITSIGGQVGWSNYSDGRFKRSVQENVPGLDFIGRLRPVTYQWDIHALNGFIPNADEDTTEWTGKYDVEKIRFSGFIAQEVEQAAIETGYDFSGVDKPQNEFTPYALRYAEFTVPLVKAVQEQQAIIEDLTKENAALKSQLEQQAAQLVKITAALRGLGVELER